MTLLDRLRALLGGGRSPAWSAAAVWDGDFPDPFVVAVPDGYLAFATNSAGINVQCLHSPDLVTWTARPDALPALAGWADAGNTWAPVVLERAGRWVMYVTVRHRASGRQAITVATSADPGGPYRDTSGGPLVFQADLGGSIDPSPFVDGDGTAYLCWKADANAVGRPSSLWAQPLSADGTQMEGAATQLLGFDAGWEQPFVEAPAMAAEAGRYVLWYSGGWWESDRYAIGYATADHPLGPWRKATDGAPWLGTDAVVAGPGGQEGFVGHDGVRRLAYHGWAPGRTSYASGGARRLHLVAVDISSGEPRLA